MNLIGRIDEVKLLEQLYQSNVAEFLAIYGRRRIGKTHLIRTCFADRDCVFFNATGTKDGSFKDQIEHFTQRIGETFLNGIIPKPAANWDSTFGLLNTAIKGVDKNKKIVLFIDELPWMATKKSKLLQTLDYYWNQYWSMDERIKLIVCGSSASWIINKIILNKGGLHNRITREIHLKPFSLIQVKHFLHSRGILLQDQQILRLFFIMGGVPFYLKKIEKGLSASQIIEELLFSTQSFLANEFDKLFLSLFDNSENHVAIVKLLAENREGIGERKLLEHLGAHAIGAKGKRILNDLEQTGFIMSFTPIYHKRQGKYYRLIDEYVLFYLKWIMPIKAELDKNGLDIHYWQIIQESAEWAAWQGYAFESVCHKHVLAIKRALKLSPTALSGAWRYAPKKGSQKRGAQIDLLFDRRDDAITLCEIKYTKAAFVISKDYLELLYQKILVFKENTGTQKQIFLALISANGIKKNQYSDEIISNAITQEDLFKEV